MGQVQSEDSQAESSENSATQDASDLELNSKNEKPQSSGKINLRGRRAEYGEGELEAEEGRRCPDCCSISQAPVRQQKFSYTNREQQHVRKLSNVSHRNIQLLSIKPRSEKDAYADDLQTRRRSSLINLILGVPSSGPRFSDDLCSLSSHITECNFGIEFFPDAHHCSAASVSSLRFESVEDLERADCNSKSSAAANQKRRRSSLGSIASQIGLTANNPSNNPKGSERSAAVGGEGAARLAPSLLEARKPSLAATLASIDLTSSFEQPNKFFRTQTQRPPLCKAKQTIFESLSQESIYDSSKSRSGKARINQGARTLRRTGSELSLYSAASAGSGGILANKSPKKATNNPLRETKSIIILQVCLPFILAGFGNMAAGLVLSRLAQWRSFHQVPIFFVLLPSFVGLKGNIEMTLASRLSTLSNLNLLDTAYQRRRVFLSNLALILSQAIGLSAFAALVSILCEFLMGNTKLHDNLVDLFQASFLVVFAGALATAITLVILSSIVVSLSVGLASLIKVNPDNLSTLIAALYGDVSCVLIYGIFADWMFTLREENNLALPITVVTSTLVAWPLLLFAAHRFKETRGIALSSMPPMLTAIMVSMGSGALLAHFVETFKLIALYQPVVNGFGANLIAVQASRVSTWLWCSELRRLSVGQERCEVKKKNLGSLASFTEPPTKGRDVEPPYVSLIGQALKMFKLIFWSFLNSSPNAVAAKLLLVMLVPAHTIYFFVIWILSPTNYVTLTWSFYLVYVALCLIQVFTLLTICEPLMSLFMKLGLDPDIFGISLLMALADLIGTLCLAGAFIFLSSIGDINAA